MTNKLNMSTRRSFLKSSLGIGAALGVTPLRASFESTLEQQTGDDYRPAYIYPNDTRYTAFLSGSNYRFTSLPSWVSVCSSAHEVYVAARKAITDNKRITVRSGGHCYEGFVDNDQGNIIDLGNMDKVYKKGKYYVVEAGARLGNTYETLLKEWGVMLPGGSCFNVAVGGHVCGGGFGAMSRKYGLTVDYLVGVEIVTFSEYGGQANYPRSYFLGENEKSDDIVWAHQGGGGGNMGIVTKYYFESLPSVPAMMSIQQLSIPWDILDKHSFAALLQRYAHFFAINRGENNKYNGLHTSFTLNKKVGPASSLDLMITYSGDTPALIDDFIIAIFDEPQLRAAEVSFAPHREAARSLVPNSLNAPQPLGSYLTIPWWMAVTVGGGGAGGARAKYKSAYMNDVFPEHQIDTLWEMLTADGFINPAAAVQISSYGGKINTIGKYDTAVSHRDSILKLQYQAYWFSPFHDDYNIDWMRKLYTRMYGALGPVSDGVMDGCYVNYPDVDLDNWQELYYKDNYPRLQRIKAQLDPKNRLHHTQSIEGHV
ncbi:FAD-dependent oxidoreductase [Pseudoalteromonas aurantia]|uniref:FAD-binding PCMH-type domain-containing protein n=1 Tax=Pseudoalteromonas aurantia 208 TaxID=1314867 RepID=A0ABR9EHR1_9GAMM|nr:FAD-binding oxidoreductase [Pseudoalteromonas aurantia]MBE0370501.1 hypothetical protein [Pseudoalteromonas aurantia 208]